MGEKERMFYDQLYDSSRKTIEDLDKQGILEARYMQVFEILMRLRQICCHPILFKSASKYVTDISQF
jgi:SNF2 family DNA or RNA helicase